MSGSGGFYKYRCKHFYAHNCPNWVLVNNTPCASCLAEGRDSDDGLTQTPNSGMPRDIYVPVVFDGTLQYTLMEIVASGDAGHGWTLRLKAPQPLAPAAPVGKAGARVDIPSTKRVYSNLGYQRVSL